MAQVFQRGPDLGEHVLAIAKLGLKSRLGSRRIAVWLMVFFSYHEARKGSFFCCSSRKRSHLNKKELRELHGLVELVARCNFYYRCSSDKLCGN